MYSFDLQFISCTLGPGLFETYPYASTVFGILDPDQTCPLTLENVILNSIIFYYLLRLQISLKWDSHFIYMGFTVNFMYFRPWSLWDLSICQHCVWNPEPWLWLANRRWWCIHILLWTELCRDLQLVWRPLWSCKTHCIVLIILFFKIPYDLFNNLLWLYMRARYSLILLSKTLSTKIAF